VSGRLRRLVLTLILALFVAVALLRFMAPQATDAALEITQMHFLKSDATAPPGADAGWVVRALPDNWKRSNPGQDGAGWYRTTLRLPQAPAEPWAMFLPTVANSHRLFVNGVDAGGAPLAGPLPANLDRPRFQAIAPHLLRAGDNDLVLRLRVAPHQRGGLGTVTVGPRAVVEALYERDHFIRVTLPRSLNLAVVFVGLLVLLLWLRRPQEAIYGVFAALALVWSLRNFYFTVDFQLPRAVWEASLGLVVVLHWIYMRRYAGAAPSRMERILIVAALVMVPVYGLLDPAVESVVRVPWYFACAMFGTWSIRPLLEHLWRTGGRDAAGPWVILGALVVTVLFGLTDFAVSAQLLPFGPVARMTYGAPLLLCALVFGLAESYFRTFDQARARNADLEQRVRERTGELERTHERLRALERVATVAAERERLMRDMHDGIGSQLITTLQAVERGGSDAQEVSRLLRECMDDLRLMIDSLAPEEHSLQVALANLRYRLEPRLRAAGLALQWDVADDVGLPTPGANLQVLRIVQEAVTNVLKHAGAARLQLSCHREGAELVLRVADDGRGMAAAAGPASARRGLDNMRMRARQLQGALLVASSSTGTALTLRVPAG
jgi:signal transduction histidine kinase